MEGINAQVLEPGSPLDDEDELDLPGTDEENTPGDLCEDSQIQPSMDCGGSDVEADPIPDYGADEDSQIVEATPHEGDLESQPDQHAMDGHESGDDGSKHAIRDDRETKTPSPVLIHISDTPIKASDYDVKMEAAAADHKASRAEIEEQISEISQQLNNAKKQLSSQFPGKIVLPFAFFCFFWLGYSLNHNPQNSNVLLVVPQTQLSGLRRARQPPASKTGGSASSSASPAIPVLESLPFGTETFETQVLPSTEMEDLATHLARESQQPEPVVPSAPVVP